MACECSVSWLEIVTPCHPLHVNALLISNLTPPHLTSPQLLPQMTLEQCSAELADTLGADACSGPPVWRVVAISALSSVLTYLGPFRNQEHARVRGKEIKAEQCAFSHYDITSLAGFLIA